MLGKWALIQTEIAAYEKQFYMENSHLPTTDNAHFRDLSSQRNYANELLQSWNITLTHNSLYTCTVHLYMCKAHLISC